ncbi:MAG TPA: FkbM family methyltransferase [Bacteroidales bacterium]|nr:FkbM family methyltransferase [Bacteroidales bacterium]HPS62589.1 FkbM family methyltransferase [Bacteroidales bacterium]
MKDILKRILCFLHIAVTRNQRYDAYTRKIIRMTLKPGANCIDIGCHKGDILDLMIRYAPGGRMFGFEPVPGLFHDLETKYAGIPEVKLIAVALYDQKGTTDFQFVKNAPAYSGIKQRRYDGMEADIERISVQTDRLDDILPRDLEIRLIKIDVEGAEFRVMQGTHETIRRWKPVIIFEFGLGAADFYNAGPDELYAFLVKECGMQISTLSGYLNGNNPLTGAEFARLFHEGKEYYFISHP